MPPKSRARWSIDPKSVRPVVDAAGTVTFSCTLLDNGVPVLTPTLTVTDRRAVRLVVHGEPGAEITDYQAWSDV